MPHDLLFHHAGIGDDAFRSGEEPSFKAQQEDVKGVDPEGEPLVKGLDVPPYCQPLGVASFTGTVDVLAGRPFEADDTVEFSVPADFPADTMIEGVCREE
ncbi:MAG: hypothetical protein MZW92_30940 [Comamonadaceae bacterium]|nr:hypothetical protein [Comamonadaceae bacterium]